MARKSGGSTAHVEVSAHGEGVRIKRDPRCRGCRNTVGRDQAVKIGGYRYHPDCADKKPRSRQVWTGDGWKHLGEWNDEEDATLQGQDDLG